MIISITGPSGSGKTTLAAGLLRRLGGLPLLSVTTRAARPTDLPGEYAYVLDEEFDDLMRRDEFIWQVAVHGNRYGTRRTTIARALEEGIYLPILAPDALRILHAQALLKKRLDGLRHLYLRVEEASTIEERLRSRGDAAWEIEKRVTSITWNEEIQTLSIRFDVLRASQTPDAVLDEALRAIARPRNKHWYATPRR